MKYSIVSLSFGDRIGIVGAILTLIGIAASVLWPDKRWIGWTSLVAVVVLLGVWAWLEVKPDIPFFFRNHPTKSIIAVCFAISAVTFLAFQIFEPCVDFSKWAIPGEKLLVSSNVSPQYRTASVTLNTSALMDGAKCYRFMLIVRVQDDTVDALYDSRIEKSEPITLTGEVRTVQKNLSDEFMLRAQATADRFDKVSIQQYFALVPKSIRADQIHTLVNVTDLGGVFFQANPTIQRMHG